MIGNVVYGHAYVPPVLLTSEHGAGDLALIS